MGIRGELFSTKVGLQNRTYFFNVKENRLGDLYLNIVESKNKETGGFERQSVILFADDLKEFLVGFDESLRVLEKAVREKRKGEPSRGGFRHGSPGEDSHQGSGRRPGQYRDSSQEDEDEGQERRSSNRKPTDHRSTDYRSERTFTPERKSSDYRSERTFSSEGRFAESRSTDRKPTDRRPADRRSEGSSPPGRRPRVPRRAEGAGKPTSARPRAGEGPKLRFRQKPGGPSMSRPESSRRPTPDGDRPAGKPRKRVVRRKD